MIHLYDKTLTQLCLEASRRYGNRMAFTVFQEGKLRRERRVSYSMMAFHARQIGLLLRHLGVCPDDRVMLLSENCPEWPLAYFGIAMAGAVSVPLLTGFSPAQVGYIAAHAGVSAIILSRAMRSKLGQLPAVLQATTPIVFIDDIINTITVSAGGREKQLSLPMPEEKLPQRKPEDTASIIYTSGTLGNSKGVMLSGLNLISSAAASLSFAKITPRDCMLSVLPLAHAYECSIGMLAPLMSGASICYLDRPPSASVLLPAAKAFRPTVMVSVPVFIEKMYRGNIAPKLQKNRLYRNTLTRPLAIWYAGNKLKRAFGGSIRIFGIGGAPLSADVEQFLRRAGFPYTTGYGLTEAAPLVTGTTLRRFPFRSSGAASHDVRIRIASCDENSVNSGVGEIQVQGPNVMRGYFDNEKETSAAFTADGWLRTGDLGHIDKKGKLFVCGRLKALILGPGGENIYPEEIESLLGSSQLVEEALVYPGEKGELIAMVRLSDAAKAAANALEHALEELRAWANKKLASFSRLSKIEIRHEPFEKTPTMKIKRHLYVQCQV